jgi:hypothetical protein
VVWIQGISGITGSLGAFSVNRDPIDLFVVVGFGILDYFLRRAALKVPPGSKHDGGNEISASR